MISTNVSLLVAVPIFACCSFVTPTIPGTTLSYIGYTGNTCQLSVLEKSSAAYNGSISLVWEDSTVCGEELEVSLERLKTFGEYKDNWNGYGAPAFSKTLLELTENILRNLDYQPEIFPIAGGAIQFEYDKPSGGYLEFEILENEDVHCLMIDRNQNERTFNLAINDINEVVKHFYGDTIY